MVFVTLVALLAIAVLIRRAGSFPPALAIMLTVSGSLLVLYGAALAGLLWWAAVAIHAVGIIGAGYLLLNWAGKPVRPRVQVTTGVFVISCVLFWLVHHDNQYFFYDEFGHWGIFLKDMLADDALWGADTNSRHPRYVPGSTLWQYLFSVLGKPTDGTAYFAQFVLLLTPLIVLWQGLRWRDAGWILGLAILVVAVLANYGYGVATLYVDHILGAWFAGILITGLVMRPRRDRDTWVLAVPLVALALLKEVGLPLALTAGGILAALTLRRAWSDRISLPAGFARATGVFLVLVLPAVLATLLWSWDRDRQGVPAGEGSVATFAASAIAGTSATDSAQTDEISRRFAEVLVHQQISRNETSTQFNAFSYQLRDLYTERFRLTTLSLLGIFLVWQIVAVRYFAVGATRWDWGIVAAGVLLATVAYLAMLYQGYARASGEYGLLLSSYVRYVNTMALPMILIAFAVLLPCARVGDGQRQANLGRGRQSWPALAFTVGVCSLLLFERPYLKPIIQDNPVVAFRAETDELTQSVSAAAGRQRVWVYLPNDRPNEFIGRFLQFQLSPTPATVERSAAFMAQDLQAILDRWSGYEYLWFPVQIDGLDKWLRGIAGDVQAGRLFRVIRDGGAVSIEAVTIPM